MLFKVFIVAFMAVGVFGATYEENMQKLQGLLVDVCKENGAENKVGEVQNSIKIFLSCFNTIFGVEKMQREIAAAKKKGPEAVRGVYKSYCDQTPDMKDCVRTVTEGATPCLDQSIRDRLQSSISTSYGLIDSACADGGAKIAAFFDGGSAQCIVEKTPAIKACTASAAKGVPNLASFRLLDGETQCGKYDEFSSCIDNVLKGCSTQQPAQVAASLLKRIKNASPCK